MKKQLITILIFLSILSTNNFAQQSIKWSHQLGSLYSSTNLREKINTIQTDKYGNVYVAGVLGADPSLDGALLTGTPGTKTAGFVAKFDCNGNLLWLHYYGDHFNDYDQVNGLNLCGNIFFGQVRK